MYKTALARQKRNKRIYKKLLKYFVSKKIEKVLFRFAPTAFVIIGMLFFNIFPTNAYFNDTESLADNAFSAGILNFDISGFSVSDTVLPGGATTTTITLSKSNPTNLDFQYIASSTIDGDAAACNYITISASNSSQNYSGLFLKDFKSTANISTDSTQWNFIFTVASDVSSADLGKVCNFKIIYTAWQTGLPENSGGFSDVAEMSGSIQIEQQQTAPTVKNVVLNEFLPNPEGTEYGIDFGTDGDSKPKGEWVELYNNGNESVDLTDWYIKDLSGHIVNIISDNTVPSVATIQSHSWLVVYMNDSILNNDEPEKIMLYDNNNNPVDSYEYDGTYYCDEQPTSGSKNLDEAVNSCTTIRPNKSFARIPDGTGDWKDPIPTPGGPNKLIEENVAATVIVENPIPKQEIPATEVEEKDDLKSDDTESPAVLPKPEETEIKEEKEEKKEVMVESETPLEPKAEPVAAPKEEVPVESPKQDNPISE
jgi:hypothetical protein